MAKHTPTPWFFDSEGILPIDRDDVAVVARVPNHPNNAKNWDANAAFIVKAVNNHERIVRALTELHAMVWGECPSLLNEDSGGNARLDTAIRDILDDVSGVAKP